MFVKYWGKIGDVRESLVRNGYEIYINSSREVYFFYDAKFDHNQGVFDTDGDLIAAFLNGRTVTAYYSMAVTQVEAPFPPVVPSPLVEPVVVEPVVAEPVIEPVATEVAAEPAAIPVFKPSLETLPTPPKQSIDFLEVLDAGGMEYLVYAKEDSTFHLHWKVSREQAKEVWRRDRQAIQKWLGVDLLNTVSWEKPVDNALGNLTSKWKEVLPEETKLSTVVHQIVSFGKRIADLAILEDGSHHVYFYMSRAEAKQVYRHIKSEFGNYPITSVSFESAIVMPEFTLVASDYAHDDNAEANGFVEDKEFHSTNKAWVGFSDGWHLHWYLCKETQRDEAIQYWKAHPELHSIDIKTVSWEHLTRHQEWVDEFHCVEPIATEQDSVAISDKELYRFLTQRIGNSLIQDDSTFYHNGHCWAFKYSDLSLSTLAQLAFRVSSFSVEAKENASRIAHTLLNGKTVILIE